MWFARIATRKPSGWRPRSSLISCADKARVAQNRSRLTVGAPTTVKARLEPLLAATKAEELMVTSMIYDHEARKHSYELLAKAFIAGTG